MNIKTEFNCAALAIKIDDNYIIKTYLNVSAYRPAEVRWLLFEGALM